MDITPANSCLYGHPLLWRKTTNILQLQTWLHILRHAPSNCTFQSQQHHSCSHRPQEKATITLKLLSTTVLALLDAWTTDWIMGLKQREQNKAGGFVSSGCAGGATLQGWERATQIDLFAFTRFCYHSWGGLLSTYTSLLLLLARMGPSALHFLGIWRICPACCPLSTKNRDGRMGVWNWSLKSPHGSFYFTNAPLALSSTWSVLLCFRCS